MDHYISFPNKSILLTKRDNPIEKVWHNQGFWQKTNKYRYFISLSIFTWIKILIGGKNQRELRGRTCEEADVQGNFLSLIQKQRNRGKKSEGKILWNSISRRKDREEESEREKRSAIGPTFYYLRDLRAEKECKEKKGEKGEKEVITLREWSDGEKGRRGEKKKS